MTSTKHTPGCWGRNIKPATKYNTIYAGRNTHVAHLETKGLPPDEVEANCNLIASAPELLTALEWLLEETCKRNGDPFDGATDTARAVIAKATGEKK